MGFAQPTDHPVAGKLLPHHFALTRLLSTDQYRYLSELRLSGGMFLWHFP